MTIQGARMMEFTLGGPNDGDCKFVPNHIDVVEVLIFTAKNGIILPSEWVHAYVRVDDETFSYDGVRQCGDTLQASNEGD